MGQKVDYSELENWVGKETGVSDWFEVDQERVNLFADATGDHQWIHIDVEKASQLMPTKSTIVHGYLTLSLLPMLSPQTMSVTGVGMGINYGANKVRFLSMVPVGSKLRVRQTIKEVNERSGGKQMISEMVMEVDGMDKPAMIAETITMLFPAG